MCNDHDEYEYKNSQMDIKIAHSYRVISNMESILSKLPLSGDYIDLGKAVGIFHDLGRFRQMLETGTYSDASSFERMIGINDHGDYGVHILFNEKLIEKSQIDLKYYIVLYKTIKYHGKAMLPDYLNYRLDKNDRIFDKKTIEDFLNSCKNCQINYLKFLSLYVHAIRDADKVDIYDQHLTHEFPIVRPYFYYGPRGDSIAKIASDWGISESEIKTYNNLESNDLSKMNLIKIPVSNIDNSKLAIPSKLIKQFTDGSVPDFKELVKQRWYNFITAAVVRLNFLRDINFTSTLVRLQEKQILERIYNLYPDKYKPLVEEIFTFAQRELIDKPIKINKDAGDIYLPKKM